MPTHYEVLGVSPGCADTEIKQAYRSALLRLHPDKQLHAADLGSTDATDLQFRLVQEAWQILADAGKRQAYDADLAHARLLLEVAVADSLTRGEMEAGGEGGALAHPCRCGGTFLLPPQDLEGGRRSVVIPCDTCSLFIEVLC